VAGVAMGMWTRAKKELDIGQNCDIKDAGVETVAERLSGCGLETLSLYRVYMGENGLRKLLQGIMGSCMERVTVSADQYNLQRRVIGVEDHEVIRVACTIQEGLHVQLVVPDAYPNAYGVYTTNTFGRQPVERETPCVADAVAVIDVVCLSGIRPCHVALPLLMYDGCSQ
jgi:hypothetical protein